jgi:hypothetical protein
VAGDVCDQLAYIPRGAVSGPGPVLELERVDDVDDALVLRLGQPHRGGPLDRGLDDVWAWPGHGGGVHKVLLVAGVRRCGRGG